MATKRQDSEYVIDYGDAQKNNGKSGSSVYGGTTTTPQKAWADPAGESPTYDPLKSTIGGTAGKQVDKNITTPAFGGDKSGAGGIGAYSGYGGYGAADTDAPVYNSPYQDQISGILQNILSNNGNYSVPSWNDKFSYDPYNNKYQDNIDSLVNQISNREAFSYDPSKDPLYQQYEQSYTRNGQRAMQDTLGQMAARTGGLASSYAGSAAQQSYNNYMSALADKVPELQQLAYSMYRDQGNDMRNNLAMYQGLENSDYNRWNSGRDNAWQEYNGRYNEYSDNWDRNYKVATQQNDDNYKLLNLLQGMDQDEYNRWKSQLGIK